MPAPHLLAQIDLNLFSDWLNSIFAQYGAITALIAVFLVVAILILRGQTNAQIAQTTLINEIARKSTDDLSKVNSDLRASEKSQNILEGRVIELSGLVKHQQDKFDEKEKAWDKERISLIERIDKLNIQYEQLQAELVGKNDTLASVTKERDELRLQIASDKAKYERIESNLKDVVEERDRLKKQLADLDKTQPLPDLETPTPANVVDLPTIETNEEKKDIPA